MLYELAPGPRVPSSKPTASTSVQPLGSVKLDAVIPESRPWPEAPPPSPLDDVYVNAPGKLALDPSGLVTVTATVPEPGGVTALIWVALVKVTAVAFAPPKLTLAPLSKFVPLIVTAVSPEVGPVAGETPETMGAEPEPDAV